MSDLSRTSSPVVAPLASRPRVQRSSAPDPTTRRPSVAPTATAQSDPAPGDTPGARRAIERVTRQLAGLTDDWVVVHDRAITDTGADMDHLVVGLSGVFSVQTRQATGRVTVHEGAVVNDGRSTDWLGRARAEARRTEQALSLLVDRPFVVRPLVVVADTRPVIARHPLDVQVLHVSQVRRWLRRQRALVLAPSDVDTLARAACTPAMWQSTRGAPPARTRPGEVDHHRPDTTSASTSTTPLRRT